MTKPNDTGFRDGVIAGSGYKIVLWYASYSYKKIIKKSR
jgi:hypothetical protein